MPEMNPLVVLLLSGKPQKSPQGRTELLCKCACSPLLCLDLAVPAYSSTMLRVCFRASAPCEWGQILQSQNSLEFLKKLGQGRILPEVRESLAPGVQARGQGGYLLS